MNVVAGKTSQPSAPDASDTTEVVSLAALSSGMARALSADRPADVAPLAQIVLKRLPRHLPTYRQLLLATWPLKQWHEGEEWGRRLLQADPNSALAWRAVARSVEERGERARALTIWLRAFEVAPFDADIRAGLARTSLDIGNALALNQACLATLYRHGFHWRQAVAEYRALVEIDPRRVDFLAGYMAALWRLGTREDAYQVARHLVKQHPHTIMAWIVIAAVGDENDRALAYNPIRSMDPDGEYARQWLRLADAPQSEQRVARLLPNGEIPLTITVQEGMFVERA